MRIDRSEKTAASLKRLATRLGRMPEPREIEHRSALFAEVVATGGMFQWAKYLGWAKRNDRYSSDIALRDLKLFVADRTSWPSTDEFKIAGYGSLLVHMRDEGGLNLWASLVGLTANKPGRPRGASSSVEVSWTYDRLRSELRSFLEGHDEWPRDMEFKAAGHQKLLAQIARKGGKKYWADQMGVELVCISVRKITMQAIEDRLLEYTFGMTEFPSLETFRADRQYALERQVQQTGGISYWALRLDFDDPSGRRLAGRKPYRAGSKRDPRQIVIALGEVMISRDTWPTLGEFQEAIPGLYDAMTRTYGIPYWAGVFGLEPNRRGRPSKVAAIV
jgi:hypothetical protein